MRRSKQAPITKRCCFEGCSHDSECIIQIGEESRDYCREHMPTDIEIVRTKFSCDEVTCPFKRTHGLPTRRGAIYCQFHATEGMIQTSTQFCGFPGCPKNPIFGLPDPKRAVRCGDHRLEGMVNVRDKMCVKCGARQATHPAPDSAEKKYCGTCARELGLGTKNMRSKRKCIICGTFATYACTADESPTHCSEHGKPLGFVDVTHKKCEKCKKSQGRCTIFPDGSVHYLCVTDGGPDPTPMCIGINPDGTKCTTHAAYDMETGTRPRFCIKHAPPGAVNIHAVLCKCPAKSRCTFNFAGLPARFCEDCKEEGMIDVVSARCIICGERAAYHVNKEPFEWFCWVHKTPDMIRSGSHPCCMPNCPNKEAIYGFPRGAAPLPPMFAIAHEDLTKRFCIHHKTIEMIDIVHDVCECPMHKRTTFFVPGAEDGQMYCAACRPDDAISENPICDQCGERATHGPLFSSAIHCAEHSHAQDEQKHDLFCEFTERFPKCQEKGCLKKPDFSVDEAYYPSHCGIHAPAIAVAIIEGVCAECLHARLVNCLTNVCGYCENDLGERKKSQRGMRERRMLKVLKECGIEPHFHNKTHPLLCAAKLKLRLDFAYIFPKIGIVLEDDEDQHANKIIAFGSEGITPLLDLTDVIEYTITAGIEDPDCKMKMLRKAKCKKKKTPHMAADGAGTSADAAEIAEALTASHTSTDAEHPTVYREGYTRVGELARMIYVQQIFKIPVIFVRYNPDEFIDHEGTKWAKSLGSERDRIAATFVKELLRKYAENAQSLHGLYVSYLYYNGQKPGTIDSFSIDIEARKITRWEP